MELYICNRDLEFVGLLEGYSSLRWTRKYNKTGEFELHIALTTEALNLLKREHIIYKKDDTEAGFIEYRNIKTDTEGKEMLVVSGKFLTGYLNRRIIWGQEVLQDMTAENAMRTLIDKNCINPTDEDRVINNLILGDLKNYTQTLNYQTSYTNLLDEIENILNTSNLGYMINLDISNKKLILDIYEGLDRTANQSTNPMCIFSQEFENILEQEYTDSLNNYRNVTLVSGAGEGSDRKFTTVGSASGLDRFELFTDARDLSNKKTVDNKEVDISDDEYLEMLKNRGKSKLSETKEIQTFDSKINLNSNLKYKVDFDLGDIVTCISKKWGVTISPRITEIEEIYEEKGLSINVTFGNNMPTLIDKIRQKIN
ncbi:MAG: siphovirus ReqiPepy6 Gp37-like family protein [Vallitalea sp.]|jgi:hypothetical protein|nr:siphovirus ReqiPepy6 Gp37-like family protein [Vallitalea sp.]